jgi:hypothetical protein
MRYHPKPAFNAPKLGSFRGRPGTLASILVELGLAAVLMCLPVRGQLAFTEVMTFVNGDRPDWVELTNFSTNEVNCGGYLFIDSGSLAIADVLESVTIQPGESIILLRAENKLVPDRAAFIAWWGEANLPPNLQVITYRNNIGLNEFVEFIQLADDRGDLLDRADFGEALRGHTFTYDTNTGCMCVISQVGVCGAFQAAQGGDIGSPGRVCGRVEMRFTCQPASVTVDTGRNAAFQVCVEGLPKPRYQWYFNDSPIGPRNADGNTLILTNVIPDQGGSYCVVLDNGLGKLTSSIVSLTVIPTNYAPVILEPPQSLSIYAGQAANFRVAAAANPPFACQWFSNGVPLLDGTNSEFRLGNVDATMVGLYTFMVYNSLGTNEAHAWLRVVPRPQLLVTEVMNLARTNYSTQAVGDWWELTNFEPYTINLRGWCWDDDSFDIGSGPTIGLKETILGFCGCKPVVKQEWYDVIIEPGESIIFVESLTAEDFIQWWGASNLPPHVKVFTYLANSLANEGEKITLWNLAPKTKRDFVTQLSFTTATMGVSWWFTGTDFDYCLPLSIAGANGAFNSARNLDVGSPGWTPWSPPVITGVAAQDANLVVSWKAPPGLSNPVEYSTDLTNWISLGTIGGATAARTATIGGMADAPLMAVRVFWEPPPAVYGTNFYDPGKIITNVFTAATNGAITWIASANLRPNPPAAPASFSLTLKTWGESNRVTNELFRCHTVCGEWQSLGKLDKQRPSAMVLTERQAPGDTNHFYQIRENPENPFLP